METTSTAVEEDTPKCVNDSKCNKQIDDMKEAAAYSYMLILSPI